jgi:hypothetical protein
MHYAGQPSGPSRGAPPTTVSLKTKSGIELGEGNIRAEVGGRADVSKNAGVGPRHQGHPFSVNAG